MNRKGFTLVELLATLVILGIVLGIAYFAIIGVFSNAKEKSEDVFVETIRDAMDMYLTSSEVKNLNFSTKCSNTLNKSFGVRNVYKVSTTFDNIIDSQYKPITQDDLVNPANKDVACANASNIAINIYRDEDYVYYYSVDKSEFDCLTKSGVISSLPEGFVC